MPFVPILIAAIIVAVTFILHFAVLKTLAFEMRIKGRFRWPLLVVVISLFVAHLAEALLYALAFLAIDYLGLGGLQGAVHPTHATLPDYFYFSLASYTTLGIGDIVSHGAIRLITGFEALNGLLLIAWSASFTYLMMEQMWTESTDSAED